MFDRRRVAVNNSRVVANRSLRPSLACLAVLGVLGLALLPSEHVHSRTENDRHSEFIHRHFEPHYPVESNPRVDHGDDDEVQWFDSSFIAPKTGSHVYPANQLLEELWTTEPPHAACGPIACAPESVHDPPWTTSNGLRAPPSARLI